MRPSGVPPAGAIARAVEGALAARGEASTDQTHDIEFSGLQPESLAADDPRRVRVRSAKEGTAFDRIPDDSPTRILDASEEMLRFVGAAVASRPTTRASRAPSPQVTPPSWPPGGAE